jgi:hypothetical protein
MLNPNAVTSCTGKASYNGGERQEQPAVSEKSPNVSIIQGIIRQERLSTPMRRLILTLLCGLLVVPAAYAAGRAAGDGVLELRAVNSTSLFISGTRGTLWGQLDRGKLVVTDPIDGDGVILVSGAEKTRPVNENVTVYSGSDLHFRVTGGRYRLAFYHASGVDLTAVGVGTMRVTGDPFAFDTGDYSVDGGKWVSVPLTEKTQPFGVQPQTPQNP